jgi:hypothetical protein
LVGEILMQVNLLVICLSVYVKKHVLLEREQCVWAAVVCGAIRCVWCQCKYLVLLIKVKALNFDVFGASFCMCNVGNMDR